MKRGSKKKKTTKERIIKRNKEKNYRRSEKYKQTEAYKTHFQKMRDNYRANKKVGDKVDLQRQNNPTEKDLREL